ncbi:MAG: flagellar basal-body MS-ring/collar protein FliF [Planctomycetota bacterium]|jgi:flagellar M-ring protein FliF
MANVGQQFKDVWGQLQVAQKATIVLVGVAFAILLAVIGYGASQPDYRVLASGLEQAQTSEIAAYLESQGVPYRLADRERTVEVPGGQLHSLRANLAEQELLGDGSVGFELLSEGGFGQSSFNEQKSYDRMVAGELERAFRTFPGVRSAKVIINRAPPSPFIDHDNQSSAAVTLVMDTGRRLSDKQLAGVIRLTAATTEGLTPDRVQVMDNQGLLTRPDSDPTALAASTSLEAEQAKEQHLTGKAQSLLDRALGPGRSMVTVAVDLDFTKRSEASTTPTTSVLRRQSTTASDEATPTPGGGGLAGTANNVEGDTGASSAAALATKINESDDREFEVGHQTRTIEEEVGRISGMTVSILLDVKGRKAAELDDSGAVVTEEELIEFTQTEQDAFAQLVLDAVGYQAALGIQQSVDPTGKAEDRFTYSIQSVPFHQPAAETVVSDEVVAGLTLAQMLDYGRYALAALMALILVMVARGQLKRSHAAWEAERAREQAAKTTAERVHHQEEVDEEVLEASRTLRQSVREDIESDPARAAEVVRGWMRA